MNLKANKISAQERQDVLIALALTRPATTKGACLTDEELACFVDHRMSRAQRLSVLEHLDTCRDCYARWADVAATVRLGWFERLDVWKQKAGSGWSQRFNRWWKQPVMGIALATACLVLILIHIIPHDQPSPDVNAMLTDVFRVVKKHRITFGNDALSLPWQQPLRRYGFVASAKPDTDINRAFGAGLHSGRQMLSKYSSDETTPAHLTPGEKAAKWTDTMYAGYFYLGRQSFLIQAVCKAEQPPQYAVLKKLTAILAHTRLDYLKETDAGIAPARTVNYLLDDMQTALQAIDRDYSGRQKFRELADAADALIDELGPKQMVNK